MKLSEYRKAVAGYLVPALVVLGSALVPDSLGGAEITPWEWVAIAIAGLSCGTVVLAVPNAPKQQADS